MRSPLRSLLLCGLSLTSVTALAQTEAPWIPAPMPTPSTVTTPAANEPIKFGAQFHGDLVGGTGGFGPSISLGIGFNRVALLFTPSITLNSGSSSAVNTVSLAVAVRIYFKSRQEAALVGFIRPDVALGASLTGSAAFGWVGVGGGVEYLLTRNLGFTAELGLRVVGSSLGLGLGTFGSLGIMLHT